MSIDPSVRHLDICGFCGAFEQNHYNIEGQNPMRLGHLFRKDSPEAEIDTLRTALLDCLRTWTFSDGQQHTHSWHDREDWIGRHPCVALLWRIHRE